MRGPEGRACLPDLEAAKPPKWKEGAQRLPFLESKSEARRAEPVMRIVRWRSHREWARSASFNPRLRMKVRWRSHRELICVAAKPPRTGLQSGEAADNEARRAEPVLANLFWAPKAPRYFKLPSRCFGAKRARNSPKRSFLHEQKTSGGIEPLASSATL
ncbi:hypothetical protein L596_022583 [Steinernema carpocapsae]|uniref:Uncharacterized protein n=1 Tax=Steinernema carpocapsae TaxID=34508 RepID=A0A4U5MM73_STECR|nr:hypothetical protein L596_022583 [Steinernema carpocapsae]